MNSSLHEYLAFSDNPRHHIRFFNRGSDHLIQRSERNNSGITVTELTGSNVVSIAEHVVMTNLILVRNFVPAHEQIQRGERNVAAVAKDEYVLENESRRDRCSV